MLEPAIVMQMAKTRGILLAPGEMFHPDSRTSGYYRFNVAYAEDERLYAFIESLTKR